MEPFIVVREDCEERRNSDHGCAVGYARSLLLSMGECIVTLPSFKIGLQGEKRTKPRIYVLEVRERAKSDGDPIAWLLIEREENYHIDERDGSIRKASIRLSYERIKAEYSHQVVKGCFLGGYNRGCSDYPCVSLTSESFGEGAIFLDPPELRGQRIGTYLMNEIVAWSKQWPAATVLPIELLIGQACDENKIRRNRFYEQFGLQFNYRDAECREGISEPILVSAITPVDTWKENLREHNVDDYLNNVLHENEKLKIKLCHRDCAISHLSNQLTHTEEKPVRWALRLVWWRIARFFYLSAILLVIIGVVWSDFNV